MIRIGEIGDAARGIEVVGVDVSAILSVHGICVSLSSATKQLLDLSSISLNKCPKHD